MVAGQACLRCCPQGPWSMLTPVVVGTLFGTRTLAGVLAGALVSGVQMAVLHEQHRRVLG